MNFRYSVAMQLCQCVFRKAREGNEFQSQIQAATEADADKQATMPQGAVPEAGLIQFDVLDLHVLCSSQHEKFSG